MTENSDTGLKIEGGLYISKITPGSPAAREGTLAMVKWRTKMQFFYGKASFPFNFIQYINFMTWTRIEGGLYILKITPGSSAAIEGNGIKTGFWRHTVAWDVLITILKYFLNQLEEMYLINYLTMGLSI